MGMARERMCSSGASIFSFSMVIAASTIPADHRHSDLTSLLDLAPTLIKLANGPALPAGDGRNLLPLDQCADCDRSIIAQHVDSRNLQVSGMIRKSSWKLIFYHDQYAATLQSYGGSRRVA